MTWKISTTLFKELMVYGSTLIPLRLASGTKSSSEPVSLRFLNALKLCAITCGATSTIISR